MAIKADERTMPNVRRVALNHHSRDVRLQTATTLSRNLGSVFMEHLLFNACEYPI